MSSLDNALLINAVVLAVVLEADLGPHRTISRFRLARPLVTAALIVPFFLGTVARSGTGLLVEVGATVAGVLLGILASKLMSVYRSPRTGRPVSRAGFGYAALWTLVVAARVGFSYGSTNWFGAQLGHWMSEHAVSAGAVTDALIFMAVAMLVSRTIGIGVRAANLPRLGTPSPVAV